MPIYLILSKVKGLLKFPTGPCLLHLLIGVSMKILKYVN